MSDLMGKVFIKFQNWRRPRDLQVQAPILTMTKQMPKLCMSGQCSPSRGLHTNQRGVLFSLNSMLIYKWDVWPLLVLTCLKIPPVNFQSISLTSNALECFSCNPHGLSSFPRSHTEHLAESERFYFNCKPQNVFPPQQLSNSLDTHIQVILYS